MGTSRYDRFSEVGNREYEESRALHIVADLVRDYPGVESVSLRGAISEVIRQVAIELGSDHRSGYARASSDRRGDHALAV